MGLHGDHLVNHIQHHELRSDNRLFVIVPCTNYVRFQSRIRLMRECLQKLSATKYVQLVVVEAAFGDREFEVTNAANSYHVQVRTRSEIWIKENLINLGARRAIGLHPELQYLAWVDGDVEFENPSWALEAIQQLQHFEVIQPWSDCLDLGPNGQVMQHFKSFGNQHQARIQKQKHPSQPYQYAHTGFAWACTRRFWEGVGGLPDFCILGSADHHAAFACVGEVNDTIHGKMGAEFFRLLREWEKRAIRITNGEVGVVMGLIKHFFHGPKRLRKYRERWQILIDWALDPVADLIHDAQGVIRLIGKPGLEQDIKLYNRGRNEDSIEMS